MTTFSHFESNSSHYTSDDSVTCLHAKHSKPPYVKFHLFTKRCLSIVSPCDVYTNCVDYKDV